MASIFSASLQMPEGEGPGTLRHRTDDAALTEQEGNRSSASSASTRQSGETERAFLYGLEPRSENQDQENDSKPSL